MRVSDLQSVKPLIILVSCSNLGCVQGAMSDRNVTEEHQLDAGSQSFPQTSRPFSSAHSSRSSSFNASAAEIILGLFREDNAAHIGPSYYEEEDPTVREAIILQHAQSPNSWVSKSLA